jgi:asparagine synthase (glutamine-hydrolysing)
MPGINFVLSKNFAEDKSIAISEIEGKMLYSKEYTSKQLYFDGSIYLGYTGFKDYPILFESTKNYFFVFEGYDYLSSQYQIINRLHTLSKNLCDRAESIDLIKSFNNSADGDFVCIIYDRTKKRIFFFNDFLGRLPIYINFTQETIVLSREVKFITALMSDYEFNRQAIAEALIFGYTLGGNTLIKNISRIEHGKLITIELKTFSIKFDDTFEINFDSLLDRPKYSLDKYTVILLDRFLEACKNINNSFPEYKKIVSLSGGFDSRIVLAGMKRVGADVSSFTFQDAGMATRGKDAIYAREISKEMNVEWELIPLPKLNIKDIERLLWIKDGLNFSQVSFILSLHTKIRNNYTQSIVHLTGDNGDRSLDPQGTSVHLKSFKSFCDFSVGRNTRINIDLVCKIVGLSRTEILDGVYSRLSGYPEKNPNNLYRHFIISERLFNWNFQAEDRNRILFWHVTPFSSFEYFHFAMQIPDNLKSNWLLTENFMQSLDKTCISVPYANWGAPICSYKRYIEPLKQKLYERLPDSLRIIIRNNTLYKDLKIDENLLKYLMDCLYSINAKGNFIDQEAVYNIAKESNVNEFHNILTVIAYMAMTIKGKESSLLIEPNS